MLKRLYIKSYFNGKSRFAQHSDRFAFAILVCLAVYLVSKSFRVDQSAAKLAGIAAGMGFFIASGLRFSMRIASHACKMRKELGIAIARRRILLDNEAAVSEITASINSASTDTCFVLIRKAAEVDEDDVFSAARKHLLQISESGKKLALIVLNEPSAKLREFAKRFDPRIEFVFFANSEQLMAHYGASEDEITEELIREAKKKPPRRKLPSAETLFSGAGKYRLLGIVLFASSFVMRLSLYTRTLGMLCIGFSFIIGSIERRRMNRATD
ncbi:MAG: hypothetical protein IKZ82_12905 [Clostridia bacterium]|nr:hypothetical protein [Clostridia bacterium]